MRILKWDETGLYQIFETTPREGVFNAKSTAVNPLDHSLFFHGGADTLIYRFHPEFGFKRWARSEDANMLLFWGDSLLRANKYPYNNLEVVKGDAVPVLAVIQDQLPKKAANHPVEGKTSVNEMVAALSDSQLVVGYSFHEKLYLFDCVTGELLQELTIKTPFPGFIPPDPTFPVSGKGMAFVKRHHEWLGGFHRLIKLAWYEDKLYGLFRKGYDGYGVWAQLSGSERSFWDNEQRTDKLLEFGPNRILMGRVQEQDDQEVVWTLWQQSSLP